MKLKIIVSCILLFLTIIPAGTSLKVGILPVISSSRTLTMDIITQKLIERGHEVGNGYDYFLFQVYFQRIEANYKCESILKLLSTPVIIFVLYDNQQGDGFIL